MELFLAIVTHGLSSGSTSFLTKMCHQQVTNNDHVQRVVSTPVTPFEVLLKEHIHIFGNSKMLSGWLIKCATKDESEDKPPMSRTGVVQLFKNKLKISWFKLCRPAYLRGFFFFFFNL